MIHDDTGNDGVNVGYAEPKVETDKALLVIIAIGDEDLEERWIPKSVIHDDSEVFSMKGGPGDLILKRWFAEKEGYV